MTEQTRNITEAVIAKNQADKLAQRKRESALRKIKKADNYLKVLRTLHLYGTTKDELAAHKADPYFSTWFKDVEDGDIHVMHSILDHFEPLEVITNLGHNYRSKFAKDSAEIILDFRPDSKIPKYSLFLDGNELGSKKLEGDARIQVVKSYLYGSILRIAKELIMYFSLNQVSFHVNCGELGMHMEKFSVSDEQVKHFLSSSYEEDFNVQFEEKVLPQKAP